MTTYYGVYADYQEHSGKEIRIRDPKFERTEHSSGGRELRASPSAAAAVSAAGEAAAMLCYP